jgi:hypothetical protein
MQYIIMILRSRSFLDANEHWSIAFLYINNYGHNKQQESK